MQLLYLCMFERRIEVQGRIYCHSLHMQYAVYKGKEIMFLQGFSLHEQIRLNVEVCFVSNTLMDKNVHRKIRVKGTYITLDRRGLDRLLFHHSAETN